jgi:hypothetical protein
METRRLGCKPLFFVEPGFRREKDKGDDLKDRKLNTDSIRGRIAIK